MSCHINYNDCDSRINYEIKCLCFFCISFIYLYYLNAHGQTVGSLTLYARVLIGCVFLFLFFAFDCFICSHWCRVSIFQSSFDISQFCHRKNLLMMIRGGRVMYARGFGRIRQRPIDDVQEIMKCISNIERLDTMRRNGTMKLWRKKKS